MKTIGLIGGMSWESTAVYYRLLNETIRDTCGGLASAKVLMHSLDFSEVVTLQKADRWDAAGEMLGTAGAGLVSAGADCLLICTNTMHLVADHVARMGRVPLIDIIDETALALKTAGKSRPLLLATRYTMEHGFYTTQMQRHGIDVLVPEAEDRQRVHNVIFDEICQGQINESSRAEYKRIVAEAKARGADSVILGCTEISLLVDPNDLTLPGFDSTRIHAAAAVQFALSAPETAEAA
ncbi:MAG: aspartate/glutamate racemase family protein [Dinoroseobacter sp.]|nr:aspartate/glutamate racemase family protein [Dinoroseobacter sp.]